MLAFDEVRYQGEPVAIVAADHPETARRAADRIEVDYEVLEPLTDPETALDPRTPPLHPRGNVLRHVHIEHGAGARRGRRRGHRRVRGRDAGPGVPRARSPGSRCPAEDGGVDLFIATQWLHVDRDQVAASLDLPLEKVRFTLAGVGGAFGGREDVSMQIHACLLALHTEPAGEDGLRARGVVLRPRPPAPGADALRARRARATAGSPTSAPDPARRRRVRVLLDRGRARNAASFALGPYDVPSARIDAYVVYTDNPPCGAMRGFGAVQTCFAHEAQMDKLAAALELDPVELRLRNAMETGTRDADRRADQLPGAGGGAAASSCATGRCPAPGGGVPGGIANVTRGEGVVRGVGYAVGLQERRLLRGLRRLLDGARAALGGQR